MKRNVGIIRYLWASIHAGLWIAFFAILLLIVPKIEAVCVDFGVDVPASARALIGASRVMRRWPFVVPLIFVAGLGFDLLVLKALAKSGRSAGLWNAVMVVVPLIVIVNTILVLLRVFIGLNHQLSG